MKRIIFALIVLCTMTSVTYSQKDKKEASGKEKEKNDKDDEKIYNKLINLYTLDKFEQCIETCDKYIKGESTARSPYPYLYSSMCYLAIHKDRENYDMKQFRDPLRKAVSFIGRFKKKDKSGELQKENGEYLRELKKAALEEAALQNEKKDYKNLQNLGRDISKNYDQDEAMLIISGVYLCNAQAKIEGEKSIETGMNILKKKKSEGNVAFSEEQADLLTQTFIMYTDYLMEIKDVAKSKTVMEFANELLPDNLKISTQSEKVMKQ